MDISLLSPKKITNIIFTVLFLFSISISNSANAYEFEFTHVDESGDVGIYNAIAVNAENNTKAPTV